jgi:GxxExxY protein
MHPDYQKADALSGQVIQAAMEVHTLKGSGLLEPLYQKFLWRELAVRNIKSVREMPVEIDYKGYVFEETLRVDLLVEICLIVETKSVTEIHPAHVAQLLSYMKLLNIPIGLLINFYPPRLKDGIRRVILKGADTP